MTGPTPYLNRLLAISDMLNSPMQKIREEAYRLLFELWREYRDDPDFRDEIVLLAKTNPTMLQEMTRQPQLFDEGFNTWITELSATHELEAKQATSKKEVGKPFYILTDHPNGPDRLNYDQYADALSELVCNPDMKTPITVGIYGQWGKGKTFLMRKIQEAIKKKITKNTERSIAEFLNASYAWLTDLFKKIINTLTMFIRKILRKPSMNEANSKEIIKRILTIDFKAWSYSTSENLRAGMVTHI
jgi:hypothetical protein